MSGGRSRQHQEHNGSGRESTAGNSGFMLVTTPDQHSGHSAAPHKSMAPLSHSALDSEALLCRETLPSTSPPLLHDDAQLPAQAAPNNHHHHHHPYHQQQQHNAPHARLQWTSAQLPASKDVQFALIVPETFLASNQHLLARATLVTTAGEDVRGAAGAVIAVQATDVGLKQDEGSGNGAAKLIAAPTFVSLTPAAASNVNGFAGSTAALLNSSVLVTTGSRDASHHPLAGLAEVASQQFHAVTSSGPTTVHVQQQLPPQQIQHVRQVQHPQQLQEEVVEEQHVLSSSQLPHPQLLVPPASPQAPEGMHSAGGGPGSGHPSHHPAASTTSHHHLPPRSSPASSSSSSAMLSAGASGAGLGLFRGSLTHGEPMSRVLGVGAQFSGGSNSAAASPYSGLYAMHPQSAPLSSVSPYQGLFQYPPAASTGPFTLTSSSRFPHIESYSAVLASMGSHVQHAAPQAQGPGRAGPYPPSPYSHRSLSGSSGSPVPTSTHSPSGPASFSLRERETLLGGGRDRSPISHHGAGICAEGSEDKGLLHSQGMHYAQRLSPGGLLKEMKGDPRDPFHKLPSGKEGSLKHRILTRPQDATAGESAYGKGRSLSMKAEEEGAGGKRTRYMTPSLPSSCSPPTDPHVFLAPHSLGPGPPHTTAPHYHSHPATSSTTANSPSVPSPSTTQASRSGAECGDASAGLPPHLHYPPHFVKGSIIQLANGDLKRVEDLQTEDFVSSAHVSADLKVDSSTVVRIEEHVDSGTATLGFSVGEHRVQVTVEATLEHPFFVFGQGWSSCCSQRTMQRYGLDCHKLSVGDVCISLTHKDVSLKGPDPGPAPPPPANRLEANKDNSRQDLDSKEDQRHGHFRGNGIGSGSVKNRSDADPSKLRGGGASRPLTHAHSAEETPPSPPSPGRDSSAHDSGLPRKRRWSAPESDSEKEKMELEKQHSDPSHK